MEASLKCRAFSLSWAYDFGPKNPRRSLKFGSLGIQKASHRGSRMVRGDSNIGSNIFRPARKIFGRASNLASRGLELASNPGENFWAWTSHLGSNFDTIPPNFQRLPSNVRSIFGLLIAGPPSDIVLYFAAHIASNCTHLILGTKA